MSTERHRRFLFLETKQPAPREPAANDGALPDPPGPAPATAPSRSTAQLRRRLIPVVPLVAITIIFLIVVGSLVAEVALIPFAANLPMPITVVLIGLASAIALGACWALWWLWRGRPIAPDATTAGEPVRSSGEEPASGTSLAPASAPRAHAVARWTSGVNLSGVAMAALLAGILMCAPCATMTPMLVTGWIENAALYPWYVQVTSALFAASVITLPCWILWRVVRLHSGRAAPGRRLGT